mmetsp:Transcript_38142/g.81379  ORF Transcript_38142/g.81379 Transcript_38142/m.81379 type:complete len:237 (-) Transcript_38142:1057-1767(-)
MTGAAILGAVEYVVIPIIEHVSLLHSVVATIRFVEIWIPNEVNGGGGHQRRARTGREADRLVVDRPRFYDGVDQQPAQQERAGMRRNVRRRIDGAARAAQGDISRDRVGDGEDVYIVLHPRDLLLFDEESRDPIFHKGSRLDHFSHIFVPHRFDDLINMRRLLAAPHWSSRYHVHRISGPVVLEAGIDGITRNCHQRLPLVVVVHFVVAVEEDSLVAVSEFEGCGVQVVTKHDAFV